ncbi:MAG: membrane protein insertion efficiency factor YidD [Myxococcales bacterium]|nr:membrane protein insertion efficiency factor YidD [Myxococcales bacterium]
MTTGGTRSDITIRRPLAWFFDKLIAGYQRWISPMTPPACRYHPSCSVYAREALSIHRFPKALWLLTWRIARCQPLSAGGFDPVPPGHYGASAATDPCLDSHVDEASS